MFYSVYAAEQSVQNNLFWEKRVGKKKNPKHFNPQIFLLDQCGWHFVRIEVFTEFTDVTVYTSLTKWTAGRDGIVNYVLAGREK